MKLWMKGGDAMNSINDIKIFICNNMDGKIIGHEKCMGDFFESNVWLRFCNYGWVNVGDEIKYLINF